MKTAIFFCMVGLPPFGKEGSGTIVFKILVRALKSRAYQYQGGQSRGQYDGVHGFPEPVKSFITFEIPSQISCGKVHKLAHIFLHKTVSKFLLGSL